MYIYNNSSTESNDFSSKSLGCTIDNGKTIFRLFAPNAKGVKLFLFDEPNNNPSIVENLKLDNTGIWEVSLQQISAYKYYAYKVAHNNTTNFKDLPYCIDPYSKAITSFTDYNNPRRTLIFTEKYDWGDDKWIKQDWRDLIIYEMHIKNMTAHSSSETPQVNPYKGLIESKRGGINYIKDLGVNTVELLPSQEYGNLEVPFNKSVNGKLNTWNPYERNHWGYMTAAFFAPSSFYSENWAELKMHEWMGKEGRQVTDFKDMIKSFHKNGIAVIMDVVYNHLSEYEIGNLKEIDKKYYFRLDDTDNYINKSYCGNDLKTESPMMRRLIIDSIIYWMTEYHIDGFRFDLGKLVDWKTLEEVISEARKINPDVIFVAEPWGGGYDPQGFSQLDWGSWNDQLRNGIKGENPNDGLGWIFGNWYGNNSIERLKSYINGTTTEFEYGLFKKAEHSVNYLESHDGYTLGDFIRLGTRSVSPTDRIKDVDKNAILTPLQTKLNKLATLFLFTSQGITMLHAGQEFAQSKVIYSDDVVDDTAKGRLDHNSYNKDNPTNYINFAHSELNSNLLNYYKGLIKLRTKFDEFRRASKEQICFFHSFQNEFSIGFSIKIYETEFIVLMNADQSKNDTFTLPKGKWEVLVNNNDAGITPLSIISGVVDIPAISGLVLRKG